METIGSAKPSATDARRVRYGVLPAVEAGAPGEAGAEAAHEERVAAGEAAFLQRFVEGDGNRAAGRVAVLVEIVVEAFGRDAELFRGVVDDAHVGLMEH